MSTAELLTALGIQPVMMAGVTADAEAAPTDEKLGVVQADTLANAAAEHVAATDDFCIPTPYVRHVQFPTRTLTLSMGVKTLHAFLRLLFKLV